MTFHKASSSHNNWNPDPTKDLDELADPSSQEEIAKSIHSILEIVSVAKKTRKEAYNFDPAKLKKEKKRKIAIKEMQHLKSQSSGLARENSILKKEIKLLEKTQKDEMPYAPKSKLFKKPTAEQRESINVFLQSIENMQDVLGVTRGLKAFNEQAEEEIKNLTKEIESDKYNYEI